MTLAEKTLMRYFGHIRMDIMTALWIMASLPTDKEILQMLEYIKETNTKDPNRLYLYALEILQKENKPN